MLVNFNGRFIPREQATIALNDSALLYGDSLFETFRADRKKIQLLSEHLDRLCLSARLLDFPCDRAALEKALAQMENALTWPHSRLRLTLGRGPAHGFQLADGSASWFCLTATEAHPPTETDRETGAACVTAPNRRSNPLDHLPQMKRGNHADCLYAADLARKKGAREALFVEEGCYIEGATSNLFALFDDRLHTPPIDRLVLAGVTRREILAAAIEYGLHVTEKALPLGDLLQADEIWLCNAMIELLPVVSIDGRNVKRGTRWREIHTLYKQRTET